MKLTNKQGLPEPIVEAIRNHEYSAGKSDITTTKLIGPPRIRVLMKRHEDEMTEDAADCIFRLMGSAGHLILEKAGEGLGIVERRFYMTVDGWTVGGQVDLIMKPDNKAELIDYKYTSLYAVRDGLKPEWRDQLQVNAELCEQNGISIETASIVAILRDWSKPAARRDSSIPQSQVVIVPCQLWTKEERLSFIAKRVAIHKAAESGELPECTEAERWQTPTTFACKKKGGKRAVNGGVFTNSHDAEGFAAANGLEVEIRRGEARRCADYCPCLPFCEQGKALVAAMNDDAE